MKKQVQRFTACLVAVSLAFTLCVEPPKAKAFSLTAGFIGSVALIYLASCGYNWLVDGMDETGLGEAIAGKIQDFLDEEVAGQSILEWGADFAEIGLSAQAGKLQFTKTMAKKLNGFAQWLTEKLGIAEGGEADLVCGDLSPFSFSHTTTATSIDFPNSFSILPSYSGLVRMGKGYGSGSSFIAFTVPGTYVVSQLRFPRSGSNDIYIDDFRIYVDRAHHVFTFPEIGSDRWRTSMSGSLQSTITFEVSPSDIANGACFCFSTECSGYIEMRAGDSVPYSDIVSISFSSVDSSSLTAEAPAPIYYPETDTMTEEQALSIAIGGSTATDIGGIISDALGRILDGTLQAEHSITDKATDIPDEGVMTWEKHIAAIWEGIVALPQTIAQAIAGFFTPDPDLLKEMSDTFNSKFGFLPYLYDFVNDASGLQPEPPVIYIHLEDAQSPHGFDYGDQEVALDLSWYAPYKPKVDFILSGILWAFFLWQLFKRAASIIRGGEMVERYTSDIDMGFRGEADDHNTGVTGYLVHCAAYLI